MKTTDVFKETIKGYLDNRAAEDPLFAEKYKNEKKNVDNCCTYILNEVKKSNRNGYADAEIFGMAMHYYDEENINPGNPEKNVRVVVNRTIEAEKKEKKEARKAAKKLPAKNETNIIQGSLF
jgi:hypothetical protein